MGERESSGNVCVSTTSSLPDLQIATVLPGAEQAETSQYSHFTFALFTLKKHQGFLSPSGFLKKNKQQSKPGLRLGEPTGLH